MAKEIPVPEELKILQSDLNKGVIVVGNKAYEIYPLYEGQFERILSDIMTVMEKVNCPDGQCQKCGKVVKGALPKKIFKCPDDESNLMTMNQSPMEAIVGSGKIPVWIEMITGIPKEEIQASITLDQQKHFAGLFWKQNFSEVGLPEESKANFKSLLEMMGASGGKPNQASPAGMTESLPSQ